MCLLRILQALGSVMLPVALRVPVRALLRSHMENKTFGFIPSRLQAELCRLHEHHRDTGLHLCYMQPNQLS